MTDQTITLTGLAAQTHFFHAAVLRRVNDKDSSWGSAELMIAHAMKADWSAARTAKGWSKLSDALHNMEGFDGKRALRRLSLAGFVYGARQNGKYCYGINFENSDSDFFANA